MTTRSFTHARPRCSLRAAKHSTIGGGHNSDHKPSLFGLFQSGGNNQVAPTDNVFQSIQSEGALALADLAENDLVDVDP